MILLYVGKLNGHIEYATCDDDQAGIEEKNLMEKRAECHPVNVEFRAIEITNELLEKI